MKHRTAMKVFKLTKSLNLEFRLSKIKIKEKGYIYHGIIAAYDEKYFIKNFIILVL
jgi:hypothetical protein